MQLSNSHSYYLLLLVFIICSLNTYADTMIRADLSTASDLESADILKIKTKGVDYYFELKKKPNLTFDSDNIIVSCQSESVTIPLNEVIAFSHTLPSMGGINDVVNNNSHLNINIGNGVIALKLVGGKDLLIRIIDISGKIIHNFPISSGTLETIDMGQFTPGIYILFSDDSIVYKFIIQ